MHSLSDYYVAAVVDSGMIPILFAAGQSTRDAGRMVGMVDGLVLSGGGDVDPGLYGAVRHDATYGDDPAVDEFEIALVHEAQAQGKPLLAICRGLQLLNVALGGTWWAVGVQWHPERLEADHHKPLFTAFRNAIENS